MNVEIITIGDEILIGQIIDTNSAFISQELNKIGVEVRQITSVQDERVHILHSLKEASKQSEIIILTGGLGPTKDDITKKCLCQYFDDELVLNEEALQNVELIFEAYGKGPISKLNRDQAMLPSKATVLPNPFGTASGMWFEENGTVVISLPGVPFEMKELMKSEVLPKLQTRFNRPFILHKTLVVYDIGESALAEKIVDWENNLPSFLKLAYLPGLGFVRLRLSARGKNREFLEKGIEEQVLGLHELVGKHIKGYDDGDSLEVQIAKLLLVKGKTLATAESCTGGKIGACFAKNPGASLVYKGSVSSYATESKIGILEVSKELIEKHTVVSVEVAKAMAENVRKLFKSDYAISTTGNAGPTKGDSDAPIGTVCIGLATPHGTKGFNFMFGNHREKIMGKAVTKSLEILLEELQ